MPLDVLGRTRATLACSKSWLSLVAAEYGGLWPGPVPSRVLGRSSPGCASLACSLLTQEAGGACSAGVSELNPCPKGLGNLWSAGRAGD